MSFRMTAALLTALTLGGSSLVLASGDTHQDDWHGNHREAAREIRQALREALHDAHHDSRLVRDVLREVVREVRAATAWTWQDADRAQARAERRLREAERRRDASERRRERNGATSAPSAT